MNAEVWGTRVLGSAECSFDGCRRTSVARGWCHAHYRQWRTRAETRDRMRQLIGDMDGNCAFEGCEKHRDSHGYCQSHARQFRLGQELKPLRAYRPKLTPTAECAFDGCDRQRAKRQWRVAHYLQWRRGGEAGLRPLRPPLAECAFDGCNRVQMSSKVPWCRAHQRQFETAGKVYPIGRYKAPTGGPRTTASGYVLVWDDSNHPNARKAGRILEHVKVMSEMLGRPLLAGENVHHKNGVRHDNRPENLELWVVSQPSGQRPEDLVAWARMLLARYESLVTTRALERRSS